MRLLLSCILSFGLCFWVSAQSQSGINFPDEPLVIGDAFDIEFSLNLESSKKLIGIDLSPLDSIYRTIPELDSLGNRTDSPLDYSIEDYGQWKNIDENFINLSDGHWAYQLIKDRKIYSNKMRIHGWDVGEFQARDINYIVEENGTQTIFNSENEDVFFLGIPQKLQEENPDSIQLAPIKGIIEEPTLWEDYSIYIYSLLSLIVIGTLIYYLLKIKKEEPELEPVIEIPKAHELAFAKLEDLKAKQLWQNGKIKAYQSELTYIIREYLEGRYDIKALESTTDEIVNALKTKDFDPSLKGELINILQIADLVKFAKAKPPLEINDAFMQKAEEFVNATKAEMTDESDE